MLTCGKKETHLCAINRILTTCAEQNLDIMSLCELGGHKEGLDVAGIHYQDLEFFKASKGPCANITQNYMTAWGLKKEAVRPRVEPLRKPKVCDLEGAPRAYPQLVVHIFCINRNALLVKGNLHIRTPYGQHVGILSRKLVVQDALKMMQAVAESVPPQNASLPVAFILVGDVNLFKLEGEDAVKPLQNTWQVHAATGGLRGDIAFVKGAKASVFELPVGASYRDRGARHDQHDAFGINLTIHGQAASVSLGAEESITIDDDGPTESHNRIPQKKLDLPNPQQERGIDSGAAEKPTPCDLPVGSSSNYEQGPCRDDQRHVDGSASSMFGSRACQGALNVLRSIIMCAGRDVQI